MKILITEADLDGKSASDDYRSGYVYLKRNMLLENVKGGKALVKVDNFTVGDKAQATAYIGYRISGDIGQDNTDLLIAYVPRTIADTDVCYSSSYMSGQFQYIVDIDKIAKRQINLKITTHKNADLTAKTDITGWMLILDVELIDEPPKK